MRSPFRYPGGKTWFVPYVRKWLKRLGGNVDLIEPFAGGGVISPTASFENPAQKIIMVEKDVYVESTGRRLARSAVFDFGPKFKRS